MFSGHWPSRSSSSSSSSLATAEGDAADGQPAFCHHQRRLGDGRGATWSDRRKRQGEHNLFFERSQPNSRDLPCAWADRTANGEAPSIIEVVAHPPSRELSLVPVDCSLWLQSHHSDKYSSHHLFYVIFESELFKMIPLVFNKPRRLNWAHLKRRVWRVVQV